MSASKQQGSTHNNNKAKTLSLRGRNIKMIQSWQPRRKETIENKNQKLMSNIKIRKPRC